MSLRLKLLLSFLILAALVLSFITRAIYESYIDAYIDEEKHIIADLMHKDYVDDELLNEASSHHHTNFITLRINPDQSYHIIKQSVVVDVPRLLGAIEGVSEKIDTLIYVDGKKFIWVQTTIDDQGRKLYTFYEMPNDLFDSFVESFGTEFLIIYFVFFWVLVWAALILSTLFERLEKQKKILQAQTSALEDKRDEAIRQSEVKSKFLANISHELRAPLNSLLGYSEMLLQSDQEMHERILGINTIIRNGEYMLNLVNDLLDLSKIEAGKLEINKEDVGIFDMLKDVQHLFATQARMKNLLLEFNYQMPVPETIYTDPVRFKQILINLISNAIKFTEKGFVKVETAYNKDGSLNVFVRDSGIGLSNEQINKIFDDYTQADKNTTKKYGGTGLGLSLSKTLANLLGGKILVSSTPGQGSVFTVQIDAGVKDDSVLLTEIPKDREDKNIYTPEEYDVRYRGTVLLVEDNVDNQNLFSNYLSRHGLTVFAAYNGKQALEMIQERSFDLIIMDAQMPLMDGQEATRQIRALGITTPIVALTGNSSTSDIAEFYAAGCNEYLAKPIKREQLIRVCKLFLPDAGKSVVTTTPLFSSLLQDEPELIDIVAGFVDRFMEILQQLRHLLEQNTLDDLKIKVHELKGSGGNVGYLDITNICSQIEFQISTGNLDEIYHLIDKLAKLHPRMKLALSESDSSGQ